MKHLENPRRYLPIVAGALLVLGLIAGVALLQDRFEKPVQVRKVIQHITVIQPPPPPPPPPREEPPPEPEEQTPVPEPEVEPEPAPEPAEEPPGEELGLDADGAAGSDGFGLVGRKGGRALLGGSAGSAALWYGGQVRRGVEARLGELLEGSDARRVRYSADLAVWIDDAGRVTRAELSRGSGIAKVDSALHAALARLSFALPKPPPAGMPQPLKIRLNSRI